VQLCISLLLNFKSSVEMDEETCEGSIDISLLL
jgi:hypothetical protein